MVFGELFRCVNLSFRGYREYSFIMRQRQADPKTICFYNVSWRVFKLSSLGRNEPGRDVIQKGVALLPTVPRSENDVTYR